MGKFDGKKLLELGTNVGSVELINYVRQEGGYVVVTDNLDPSKSAAKRCADEYRDVSTVDVEAVCNLAKEIGADAIFCGIGEPNLVAVGKATERMGMPCYFTPAQWELLENKAVFKKLCKEAGLPIAKEYEMSDEPTREELDKIEYPVIVKPVDQGAGIGIHVCNNEEELLEGFRDALEKSYSHAALVEQYVRGVEFSAAYTVIDGKFALSTIGDKLLIYEQEGLLPLPEAYIYPSRNIDLFREKASNNVIKLLESVGLKNGTAFVQGICDGEKFIFFEAGLRMGATALFRFVARINGINILHLLTDYAMTGEMKADLNLEDPYLKGKKCCLLSLLNKGGVVGKISGVEEASKVEGVLETVVRYPEGAKIERSGTLKQSHIRFFVARSTANELADSIRKIQNLVRVVDIEGNDMLLTPFNTDKLKVY